MPILQRAERKSVPKHFPNFENESSQVQLDVLIRGTNISGGVLQHGRGVRFFGDEDARARRRALVVDPARSGGGAWQTDEGSPRAMRRSAESLRRAADDTLRARTREE